MNDTEYTRDEMADLQAELDAIGPWVAQQAGIGGQEVVLRAERLGTHRYEQAATNPDALLEAVREAEGRIPQAKPTPIAIGLSDTNNIKQRGESVA